LREVTKTGKPICVEYDGKPVAIILSVREYERLRRVSIQADKTELVSNAFGMWLEHSDIEDGWIAKGRACWESE